MLMAECGHHTVGTWHSPRLTEEKGEGKNHLKTATEQDRADLLMKLGQISSKNKHKSPLVKSIFWDEADPESSSTC